MACVGVRRFLPPLLFLVLAVAGCAGDSEVTSRSTGNYSAREVHSEVPLDIPIGPVYVLEHIWVGNDEVGPPDPALTLQRYSESSLIVRGSTCLALTYHFTMDGGILRNAVAGSTLMTCEPGLSDVEAAIKKLLATEPMALQPGKALELHAGEIVASFRTSAANANSLIIPTETELLGVRTTIEGVVATDLVLIADSFFAGSLTYTDCILRFSFGNASMEEAGDRSFVAAVDSRACDAGVFGRLIEFMADSPKVELDESLVRLRSERGEVIEFVAGEVSDPSGG